MGDWTEWKNHVLIKLDDLSDTHKETAKKDELDI